MLLVQLLRPSLCDYGGHDLFTSLAQLGELWRDEREVVRDIRTAMERMEEMKEVLQRYVIGRRVTRDYEQCILATLVPSGT